MADACDHLYMRTGEQRKRKPMRDYSEIWDVYVCQHCLKHQYVLVTSINGYIGEATHHDGSKRRDRLEGEGN